MDNSFSSDRLVRFSPESIAIPERLLLAHDQGKVLFITGAGTSQAAKLPDFRELVLEVYKKLDNAVYNVLQLLPPGACNQYSVNCTSLNPLQCAEIRYFTSCNYDVVLGLLERRLENVSNASSKVREAIATILREAGTEPATLHKSIIKLADRGGTITLATTNFDLLLEAASRKLKQKVQSYALGAIPRPSNKQEFTGIFHIHGSLASAPDRLSDLIVTDHDFGEFYLRRRAIPDFIYDAARLFHIVLVGYSASDPPMQYLLNAVAADGSRFDDLKERFIFIGCEDPDDKVVSADWKGRGITPIPYSQADKHSILPKTFERWAEFSMHNGKPNRIKKELRRIVSQKRSLATDIDKDLFDYFLRRGNPEERAKLSLFISECNADFDWLDALILNTQDLS